MHDALGVLRASTPHDRRARARIDRRPAPPSSLSLVSAHIVVVRQARREDIVERRHGVR
jgi:hypothetical protein